MLFIRDISCKLTFALLADILESLASPEKAFSG